MVKVSLIQSQPILGEAEQNIQNLIPLLAQTEDSALIVLPELANSGYNFTSRNQAMKLSESIEDSRFIEFLHQHARASGCHIVAGMNERERDLLYNTAVLVGPDGIIGRYRKLHLFMNEKDIFEPGNRGLPVFDVGQMTVGIQICFDYLFPETWRILGLKGAGLICHPSNLVTPYGQKVVPMHSVVNGVYVITANRTGADGDLKFSGGSIITGTRGEVLARASENKPEVITIEIDPQKSRNKMITEKNHALNDRRPDQYLDILES
ncbi:MAG: hypothetical protein K9H13_10025 [Bacteroidales bacterium]|nr:hypothetical protein [Bacteroidales bacterium]